MNNEKTGTSIEIETTFSLGHLYKAILFNDEVHYQGEVVSQIMKAIHCDAIHATGIMMAAHKSGSAVVFTGTCERCELVASVLEKKKLLTKVEEA